MNKCISKDNSKEVCVSENSRRFGVHNPKREYFEKILIDGCLIKSGERCDFAIRCEGEFLILIELKGSDLKKAVSQLVSTVRNIALTPYVEPKIGLAIVCSRVPKAGPSKLNLQDKVRK